MKKIINLSFLFSLIVFLSACSSGNQNFNRPTIGKTDAKVLIEEFSDFQCPACGAISPQLEEIVTRNSDKARLVFYNFPLPYHENAFKAAEAAECANVQGKFWEYMNMAFKNQDSLTDDNLKSFASALNLDTEAFNKCLDNGQMKEMVKADSSEGTNRDLAYTPSIYVNGQLVEWTSAEEFEKYIQSL